MVDRAPFVGLIKIYIKDISLEVLFYHTESIRVSIPLSLVMIQHAEDST
jgi:hypothetical protein